MNSKLSDDIFCNVCPQSSAFGCNGKEYCECYCHLGGDIELDDYQ